MYIYGQRIPLAAPAHFKKTGLRELRPEDFQVLLVDDKPDREVRKNNYAKILNYLSLLPKDKRPVVVCFDIIFISNAKADKVFLAALDRAISAGIKLLIPIGDGLTGEMALDKFKSRATQTVDVRLDTTDIETEPKNYNMVKDIFSRRALPMSVAIVEAFNNDFKATKKSLKGYTGLSYSDADKQIASTSYLKYSSAINYGRKIVVICANKKEDPATKDNGSVGP
ncbi:MAG: hypothetical protein AABZ57_05060, partial [Candidatus Margulisiibacteriota bacterium]